MRILFSSTRGAGRLQPLLPYARALVARGHEVRVAAPAEVAKTIADADGGAMLRKEPVFATFPHTLDDPSVKLAGLDPIRVRMPDGDAVASERWTRSGAPLVYIPSAPSPVHGGSGTMLGGAAAGVPMVIAALGADQPHNAEQIARVGAGLATKVDADEIRAALVRVLEEGSFKAEARRLAAEMAMLPALDTALDALLAAAR